MHCRLPLSPPPQSHCPKGSDLQSGLTALAQCWLAQGITGSFRQEATGGPAAAAQQQRQEASLDLAPWFDSLPVRLVILVSKGPGGGDTGGAGTGEEDNLRFTDGFGAQPLEHT
jgi:hypothetical protein